LRRAGVAGTARTALTKLEIALQEIDEERDAGVRFGCVLADAGYGLSAPPARQGLSVGGLIWSVGIPRRRKVFTTGVD
jgi:SRSO17 transposase